MPLDDLDYEIRQARAAFAQIGAYQDVDIGTARGYLKAAIAGRKHNVRTEWAALFGFWRTIIQGGWRCPDCAGRMEYGEASGVRCTRCRWVPGVRPSVPAPSRNAPPRRY